MTHTIERRWQAAFMQSVQQHENATALKQAALQERLGDWTRLLTDIVVGTFQSMDWRASAKGNRLELLPIARSEYLALDVVAFPSGQKRWRFPVAVAELENSKNDDRIAYALWKVLCVQAELRVVFCYRRSSEQGSQLVQFLRNEVVEAMDLESRSKLSGQTIIVVGSRGDADIFPYGYFKWWLLEGNTSTFRIM